MEPTADAFNSIIKLDTRSDKPFNPNDICTISLRVNYMIFQVNGVSTCAAKNGMGFGLYGSSLDACGNSVAAVKAMEYISK